MKERKKERKMIYKIIKIIMFSPATNSYVFTPTACVRRSTQKKTVVSNADYRG